MKTAINRIIFILLMLASIRGAGAQEKVIILNEGSWQADNGRLSYFEDGAIVSNSWFRDVNGSKIGDTPNDIIQIDDNLIAISVNWSNLVQFISPEGKALGATEDVPNNRCLASDGNYVYVTSYAHECTTSKGVQSFERGFVAKIDVNTFKAVDAVEVGYEPEGIALYKGHLFVENSGGYAYQEDHEYGHTISIVDPATMTVTRTVDVVQINLYGTMSQSGQYLCINSPGDYYTVDAATIIFDCEAALAGKPDADCFVKLAGPSTFNTCATDGSFFTIGSAYSYITGNYDFTIRTIDPAKVMSSDGLEGVTNTLPGTLAADFKAMSQPYGIYVNPYTGYIYGTDAASYASSGRLYQWSPEGQLLGKHTVYINPGSFLALPPDGHIPSAIDGIKADGIPADNSIYDLKGIRVTNPRPGQIYIRGGKKFILK